MNHGADGSYLPLPSLYASVRSVKVHPVVVLSVLDHHARRHEDQSFVIGALLGNVSQAGEIEIRNHIPLLHSSSEPKAVEANLEFQNVFLELQQKVNTKDAIVGWYVEVSGK